MLASLHKVLENPRIYNLVQKLLAGERVNRVIKEAVALHLHNICYNNVLDVGCGTGLFADCFKGEYTGIDISQKYIKIAQSKREGVFLVDDATSLRFGSETFDLVFSLGVLHHLDKQNREKMLHEMWRVCKVGGVILIIDGLVPSNRLNIVGYILAKIDRGRYKVRFDLFRKMIENTYRFAQGIAFTNLNCFPYELAFVTIHKEKK